MERKKSAMFLANIRGCSNNAFIENKLFSKSVVNRSGCVGKVRFYTTHGTVCEKQGNRLVEKHFWSTPKREKRQEEELKKLQRNKNFLDTRVAKWPDLEAEEKMWIRGYRNNGVSVYQSDHF